MSEVRTQNRSNFRTPERSSVGRLCELHETGFLKFDGERPNVSDSPANSDDFTGMGRLEPRVVSEGNAHGNELDLVRLVVKHHSGASWPILVTIRKRQRPVNFSTDIDRFRLRPHQRWTRTDLR